VSLLIINGSPLDTIVSNTMKIEKLTWYSPRASAPIVLEI